jgi:hypothetical protein
MEEKEKGLLEVVLFCVRRGKSLEEKVTWLVWLVLSSHPDTRQFLASKWFSLFPTCGKCFLLSQNMNMAHWLRIWLGLHYFSSITIFLTTNTLALDKWQNLKQGYFRVLKIK